MIYPAGTSLPSPIFFHARARAVLPRPPFLTLVARRRCPSLSPPYLVRRGIRADEGGGGGGGAAPLPLPPPPPFSLARSFHLAKRVFGRVALFDLRSSATSASGRPAKMREGENEKARMGGRGQGAGGEESARERERERERERGRSRR